MKGELNMTDIRKDPNVVRETTEAQIAVHWGEEKLYYPPAKFIGQANLADPDVNKRFSEENFPDCFQEYAEISPRVSLKWRRWRDSPPWWWITARASLIANAFRKRPRCMPPSTRKYFRGWPSMKPAT